MKSICKTLGWVTLTVLAFAASAAGNQGYGTLTGVVLDPSGTPQMGATVWLISEDVGGRTISKLLSNQHGAFSTDHLAPGSYAVRVSLAGFLPAMKRHVAVMADLTTMLRVQMDSVFASLDTLRRKSDAAAEPDDWKWVLRSSAATRTVLQWRDTGPDFTLSSLGADLPEAPQPRGLVQMSNGAVRSLSPSNLPDAPATSFSYDQQLGALGRVLLAGQMNYQYQYLRAGSASGAFATVFLPSGSLDGPETVVVVRQTRIGPDGLTLQGLRVDHTEHFALGDRVSFRAGAEFVRAGIVSSVSALRPHAQLDANLSQGWSASMVVAASPLLTQWGQTGALESAIAELDTFPAVLFSNGNGNPVLEGGLHEEFSVRHKLTGHTSVEAAGFHDAARHEAIFGSGLSTSTDLVQDTFSSAYLYDGGGTSSWGTRVVYSNKLSDNLEFAAIYAWAGALSPTGELSASPFDLHDSFTTRNHHSLTARVSGKIPGSKTQFSASYKWISGTTVSPLDAFGEAAYQIDPNLHLSVRQPLPGFNGRLVALAECTNLLAQGYVTVNGQDSRMQFVPVMRSFRGGVSFQF
jgi:hypothetical protein